MIAETPAENVNSPVSPLVEWLPRAKARLGVTWGRLANSSGISIDTIRRLREGNNRNLPRPETLRRLTSALDVPKDFADFVLAWLVQCRTSRRSQRVHQSLFVHVRTAKCRVCSRVESLSTVRNRRTFVPAGPGRAASFIHRDCAGQPGKVTLICPQCGQVRRVYMSKRRKRSHQDQMTSPGTYAIPCRPCNVSLQGRRQIARMNRELVHRFRQLFRESRYHRKYDVDVILDRARLGDPKAKRIKQEVLSLGYKAPWSERRKSGPSSPVRGQAISKGQLFLRWPERIKGLCLCPLCWLLVHGRKYHPICWKTWMKSREFQRERERRRWSVKKPGRSPIDPPIAPFRGRPAKQIQQKYVWFMRRLVGTPVTTIAAEAGVSKPTVSIGIGDFKRWLPGSWDLVFRAGTESAIQLRETRFSLQHLSVAGREARVRWLAGWGMRQEDIGRLVGYPVGRVEGILRAPVGTVRGSPDDPGPTLAPL